MERFRGRVFLIAICLSFGATRLQAGDKPAADRGRAVVASDAVAVNTGTPATNDASLNSTNTDRLADADDDSASSDSSDASAPGDTTADGSEAAAPDSAVSPAVAASADSAAAAADAPRAEGDHYFADPGHPRTGLLNFPVGAASEGLHHGPGRHHHQDCSGARCAPVG